jgi:hypothetical protein
MSLDYKTRNNVQWIFSPFPDKLINNIDMVDSRAEWSSTMTVCLLGDENLVIDAHVTLKSEDSYVDQEWDQSLRISGLDYINLGED